jgi:hypothetical protein
VFVHLPHCWKNVRCLFECSVLSETCCCDTGCRGTVLVNYFLGSLNSVARQLLIEASMSIIFDERLFISMFQSEYDVVCVEVMVWVKTITAQYFIMKYLRVIEIRTIL